MRPSCNDVSVSATRSRIAWYARPALWWNAQLEAISTGSATSETARSCSASPVESKSVISSREARPSAVPASTSPMPVTSSRVIATSGSESPESLPTLHSIS